MQNNIDCVPSNVQSSRQEALLHVVEDNEAVTKMIMKGRSPIKTCFQNPRSCSWLFDRINLDPKIQIKYIDTQNQVADMQTKGNFTRDDWNHLLCLFDISHFSSTVCSDTVAKRSQQDSGEGRVTAKSRPMMNLIARTPSHVSSSTSVSPGKGSYGSQDPWSLIAKKEERSGRPDKGTDLFEASDHIIITMSSLWKASLQQVTESGMTTALGLLKSGKLRVRHTSDRGDLIKLLGKYEKFDLVTRKFFSTEPRNP